MGKKIDLTGKRFGRLVALSVDHLDKRWQKYWLCACDCGKQTVVRGSHLTSGTVKSCGCLSTDLRRERNKTHGLSKSRLFIIWQGMKARCYYEGAENYRNYGGRGITVCEEWRHDFLAFYRWAISSGYKDGLTLDRIDNDKGYCPDNCRWATREEQTLNRKKTILINYKGETKPLVTWCRCLGIGISCARARLKKFGKDNPEKIFEPVRRQNRRSTIERS